MCLPRLCRIGTRGLHLVLEELIDSLGNQLHFSTAFHPHIDGQSERTIQTLEDMLRACIMDFAGERGAGVDTYHWLSLRMTRAIEQASKWLRLKRCMDASVDPLYIGVTWVSGGLWDQISYRRLCDDPDPC